MVTAPGLATKFADMGATLDAELSPRKLDLVGVKGIVEILTRAGKVNRKTGEPLTLSSVSLLTQRDPTFPKPWIEESARRYWRRADVEKWVPTWDQRDGPKTTRTELILKIIDGQPDRVWTTRELWAEVQKNRVFVEPRRPLRPLRALGHILTRTVQAGRIRRVGPGRYRSLLGSVDEEG